MKNTPLHPTMSVHGGLLLLLALAAGCSLQKAVKTPRSAYYGTIDSIPLNDGQPKGSKPWIVFADRDKAGIHPSKKEDPLTIYKQAAFMDPFVVLKQRKGMVKVAAYKPELINDGKLPARKALKVIGWIPEEQLLLWNSSLRSAATGFSIKAAIVVNDTDVVNHSEKYLGHDSVMVFSSPDLITKTKTRLALGSIVYIYKISEDGKRYLLAGSPGIPADSIAGKMYGWVSKNIVSVWGSRTALKMIQADTGQIPLQVHLPRTDSLRSLTAMLPYDRKQQTGIESIFPVLNAGSKELPVQKHTRFFTNAFDYSQNRIYNVLGTPVFYDRYREILEHNRKLNVVFVLDISRNNRLYLPVAKSLLQELQLDFTRPGYFSSVNFGGVIYRQNTCRTPAQASSLSSNYRDVTQFLESKMDQPGCRDTGIAQPVDQGLLSAADMLSGREDETNIIIVVGTTGAQNYAAQPVINALTRVNARLIFFQSQAKSDDLYNDFVLAAQKTLVNTANNIAEMKKERIVSQNDLLTNTDYSLASGESGVYYLDYPKQSMTQGFAIFPKKGEVMPAGVLKIAIDSMLSQVTRDNQQTDSALTAYFRSEIGVNNTFPDELYQEKFNVGKERIPSHLASALLLKDNAFLVDGIIDTASEGNGVAQEYGLLLNEQEYDQLKGFYTEIWKATLLKKHFRKRKALKMYVNIIRNSNLCRKKLRRRTLNRSTMNELTALSTGFPLQEDSLMSLPLKRWKRKTVSKQSIQAYFGQYREKASKLGISKGNEAVRINCNGQVFYWLTKDYVPCIGVLKTAPRKADEPGIL